MLGGGGSSQRISPSGSDPPGGHGAADSPDGAPISSSLGIWVAPAGGAPPSSSLLDEPGPAGIGGWASADAARVGGGIYEHLCQAIYLLAVDPKPQVKALPFPLPPTPPKKHHHHHQSCLLVSSVNLNIGKYHQTCSPRCAMRHS